MSSCQSCGMPMMKPDDHGGGRLDNAYCKYCTDTQGNLLPKDQVREKMIQFHIQNLGKTQQQAEVDVDRHMALMPVWKASVGASVPGRPGALPFRPGGLGSSPHPSPLAGSAVGGVPKPISLAPKPSMPGSLPSRPSSSSPSGGALGSASSKTSFASARPAPTHGGPSRDGSSGGLASSGPSLGGPVSPSLDGPKLGGGLSGKPSVASSPAPKPSLSSKPSGPLGGGLAGGSLAKPGMSPVSKPQSSGSMGGVRPVVSPGTGQPASAVPKPSGLPGAAVKPSPSGGVDEDKKPDKPVGSGSLSGGPSGSEGRGTLK